MMIWMLYSSLKDMMEALRTGKFIQNFIYGKDGACNWVISSIYHMDYTLQKF